APVLDCDVVHVRLSGSRLHRPRQWGACWLACHLWDQLRLDDFWSPRLPASRQGTRWLNVLKTLVTYRLVDPGSEWRLHRQWYAQNAIGDLLGEDFAVAGKDNLYRCLDKLLAHKQELFSFLRQRWQALVQAGFEILLYGLTSTYFALRSARNRQAAVRPLAGPQIRLRPGGHCPDRDPRGFPADLRGDAGQYLGQDDAGRLPQADRGPIWQSRAHLGNGPWHPDGSRADRDAGCEDANPLPGRHTPRAAQPVGARIPGEALGTGSRFGSGEAD